MCPAVLQHAAAAEALRIVAAETAVARHRLTAVRYRWIPRLEHALAQTTLAIEELERADSARLLRAVSQAPPPYRLGGH